MIRVFSQFNHGFASFRSKPISVLVLPEGAATTPLNFGLGLRLKFKFIINIFLFIREKLAVAIENEGYVKKLLNVFRMCEDLESSEGLHHLYEIFKNVFLLNKNALFELMFAEDTIFDVVGCLENDPALPR